jgi:hypothetical protein
MIKSPVCTTLLQQSYERMDEEKIEIKIAIAKEKS